MTSPRPTIHEVAPVLRPAQVLLVGRRGWLGWIIRRVTRSWASHAALISQDSSGVWIVLEAADLHGVQANRLERFLEDPTVVGLRIRDCARCTDLDRAQIVRAAWLRVGASYDTLALISIYVRRRFPWAFGRQPLGANRFDSAGRYFCSELVTLAYQDTGIPLAPDGTVPGTTDPGHLAETLGLRTVWAWGTGRPAGADDPSPSDPAAS